MLSLNMKDFIHVEEIKVNIAFIFNCMVRCNEKKALYSLKHLPKYCILKQFSLLCSYDHVG